MNAKFGFRLLAIFFVFIFIASFSSTFGQTNVQKPGPPVVFAPFDFADDYYLVNGLSPKWIVDRRTGSDGWSVFDKATDPNHSEIRVLGTIPAYNEFGELMFWYPLGDFEDNAFTEDRAGANARRAAANSPIYIFPDRFVTNFSAFTNGRHAPVIDNSWARSWKLDPNRLGLREIFVVNYTEKAFDKEGIEMMAFFGKKNGFATDDTPILKSIDDIRYLEKMEFVTVVSNKASEIIDPIRARYAIAPIIADPRNGAIKGDAFLWMFTKDGQPLPSEEIFVTQFGCLKDKGDWCL
jgi:hypothetical protein